MTPGSWSISIAICALAAGVFCGCRTSSGIIPSDQSTAYPEDVRVIKRDDWGWIPPAEVIDEHTITRITIHHGGEAYNPERDTDEYLRSLQSWSRSERGWMDIPYHFVIDLTGEIHEARPLQYPGDTNTEYDPRGHALIVLVGNYEEIDVSNVQLEALADLIAYLSVVYDVDLNLLKAHKDFADTACPGKNLYSRLQDGTISKLVQARLVSERN